MNVIYKLARFYIFNLFPPPLPPSISVDSELSGLSQASLLGYNISHIHYK